MLWACFVGIPTMVDSGKQLSRDMDLHLAEHEAAPGMTSGCVEAMHTWCRAVLTSGKEVSRVRMLNEHPR